MGGGKPCSLDSSNSTRTLLTRLQLAVVVASLARNRASLAVGNIVGSAISNILGAFALGILFHKGGSPIVFDRSARIYSLVLLVLTTFVTPITYFSIRLIWLVCGSLLIAFFAVYLASVGWAISKGTLTAPEDSDDDSSDDDSDERSDLTAGRGDEAVNVVEPPVTDKSSANSPDQPDTTVSTTVPTKETREPPVDSSQAVRPKRHGLRYHVGYLVLGFLAICLAGYVLSHAATTFTDELGISDVLFGVIILSIATTLPEKFIAILSGHRGQVGILVANTAGSNIFLLSLCSGIVMLETSGKLDKGNVNIPELGVLWASTLAFTLTVWLSGRFTRWISAAMLLAYVAFIILEFTVIHNVAKDT